METQVYLIWACEDHTNGMTQIVLDLVWDESLSDIAKKALAKIRDEDHGRINQDCWAAIMVNGVIKEHEWLSVIATSKKYIGYIW